MITSYSQIIRRIITGYYIRPQAQQVPDDSLPVSVTHNLVDQARMGLVGIQSPLEAHLESWEE